MADHLTPAPAERVEFTSELTPNLLAVVLAAGALANPLVLTIMLSGPVFLAVGALTGGGMLLQWGYTFLVALPAIPLLTFGMAYLNAHRKGSADVLAPVHVVADAGGVTIESQGETRHAGWSTFQRWRRMAGTHLLYTTPRTFMILRTDGLAEGERAAFEALLREHVPVGPRR